jgi:hypothetical protein
MVAIKLEILYSLPFVIYFLFWVYFTDDFISFNFGLIRNFRHKIKKISSIFLFEQDS